MTSSNTAEYKFYLKSGVIKFQFIIIIISSDVNAFSDDLRNDASERSIYIAK